MSSWVVSRELDEVSAMLSSACCDVFAGDATESRFGFGARVGFLGSGGCDGDGLATPVQQE